MNNKISNQNSTNRRVDVALTNHNFNEQSNSNSFEFINTPKVVDMPSSKIISIASTPKETISVKETPTGVR